MNPKWSNFGTIFNWLLKRITVLLIVLHACDVISLPWWGVLAPLFMIFQSTLPVRGATAKMHSFTRVSLAIMQNYHIFPERSR